MSITVSDCLKIGILQKAKVVAGRKGLHRSVENVSTLEFDGYGVDHLAGSVIHSNEMILSALYAFKDDPDKLISFLHRLTSDGFSCLVIFYLNDVMKELPEEALRLCDRKEIPLIVLPGEGLNYGYCDVIMPITEAIIKDRKSDTLFVSDTIQDFLSLPDEKKTLHSVLELLRDKVGRDLLLIDPDFQLQDYAVKSELDPADILKNIRSSLMGNLFMNPSFLPVVYNGMNIHIRIQPVRMEQPIALLLSVSSSEAPMDIDSMTQAAEVLKLFLQLWRVNRSRFNELEVLLQGGQSSARQQKIRAITVIRRQYGASLQEISKELRIINFLEDCSCRAKEYGCSPVYFNGSIVLAETDSAVSLSRILTEIRSALNIRENLCAARYELAPGDTAESVYMLLIEALPAAGRIFAPVNILNKQQILFAREITEIIKKAGTDADFFYSILQPLLSHSKFPKLFETLKTVYFSCDGNVNEAAKLLNIHINTLRNRIRQVETLLGLDLSSSLGTSQLLTALAVFIASQDICNQK